MLECSFTRTGCWRALTLCGRPFDLVSAVGALSSGPLDEAVQAVVTELDEHTHGRITDDVTLMAFEDLAAPPADAGPANCFATGHRGGVTWGSC